MKITKQADNLIIIDDQQGKSYALMHIGAGNIEKAVLNDSELRVWIEVDYKGQITRHGRLDITEELAEEAELSVEAGQYEAKGVSDTSFHKVLEVVYMLDYDNLSIATNVDEDDFKEWVVEEHAPEYEDIEIEGYDNHNRIVEDKIIWEGYEFQNNTDMAFSVYVSPTIFIFSEPENAVEKIIEWIASDDMGYYIGDITAWGEDVPEHIVEEYYNGLSYEYETGHPDLRFEDSINDGYAGYLSLEGINIDRESIEDWLEEQGDLTVDEQIVKLAELSDAIDKNWGNIVESVRTYTETIWNKHNGGDSESEVLEYTDEEIEALKLAVVESRYSDTEIEELVVDGSGFSKLKARAEFYTSMHVSDYYQEAHEAIETGCFEYEDVLQFVEERIEEGGGYYETALDDFLDRNVFISKLNDYSRLAPKARELLDDLQSHSEITLSGNERAGMVVSAMKSIFDDFQSETGLTVQEAIQNAKLSEMIKMNISEIRAYDAEGFMSSRDFNELEKIAEVMSTEEVWRFYIGDNEQELVSFVERLEEDPDMMDKFIRYLVSKPELLEQAVEKIEVYYTMITVHNEKIIVIE